MAEQELAWYGLSKKIQTAALRFAPINKVFLGTSVSINNATQSIKCALEYKGELWYEPFSIVDEAAHVTPVVVLTGHLTRKEAEELKVEYIIGDVTKIEEVLNKHN